MGNWIQRDASQQTRGVIAKSVGHPGVRRFVCRNGKHQNDHVNQELWDYFCGHLMFVWASTIRRNEVSILLVECQNTIPEGADVQTLVCAFDCQRNPQPKG